MQHGARSCDTHAAPPHNSCNSASTRAQKTSTSFLPTSSTSFNVFLGFGLRSTRVVRCIVCGWRKVLKLSFHSFGEAAYARRIVFENYWTISTLNVFTKYVIVRSTRLLCVRPAWTGGSRSEYIKFGLAILLRAARNFLLVSFIAMAFAFCVGCVLVVWIRIS